MPLRNSTTVKKIVLLSEHKTESKCTNGSHEWFSLLTQVCIFSIHQKLCLLDLLIQNSGLPFVEQIEQSSDVHVDDGKGCFCVLLEHILL